MGKFVVFDGPIGVGKTSLARRFAEWSNSRLMLEEPEENPFLVHFYEDVRRYAFQVQIFFLLSRYREQKEALQGELFSGDVVADHSFEKDAIFASLNLDEHELKLYDSLARELRKEIPPPDLIVFLQARPEVLMRRIRKRGRTYERKIGIEYIRALCETYNHFFFHYRNAPVMVVDTSELDLEGDPVLRESVFERMTRHKSGTVYYHLSPES